jgi:hypothetical protein
MNRLRRLLFPESPAVQGPVQSSVPYSQKTLPGRCPPRTHCSAHIDDRSGPAALCQWRFPASLIYALIVSPPKAVPSTLMPLPSRSTSADLPVVLDTVLLPCSPLPLAAKETKSDCLCPDGCAPRGTTRQRNSHNIESREVLYPWHPWHARTVTVHEAFTRNKRAVFQCGVDEKPGGRLLEIPQWMFDSVACCRMRMAKVPAVGCGALLDLKTLLRCASFPDSDVVLQDQHRSLLLSDAAHNQEIAG